MASTHSINFIYVGPEKDLPELVNRDKYAIYFGAKAQQLWVGDKLIADHIDVDSEIQSYLQDYKVKSIEVLGSGDNIADASFDAVTGKLSLTKGNLPVIGKGASGQPTETSLSPGQSFTTVVDTSVSDNNIYDSKTIFTLPDQIVSIAITKDQDEDPALVITSSDGTISSTKITQFATAEQGQKADGAMQSVGGVATGASVQLESDPQEAMDAATKQYVDEAIAGISGATRFLGVSTTAITDGGTEAPTIDGVVVPVTDLHSGDTVLYDPNNTGDYTEFIWDGSKWIQLGSGSSYARKDRRIIAGDGLSGGGNLEQDVNLSHGSTGSGSSTSFVSAGAEVVDTVSVDKFGHLSSVTFRSLTDSDLGLDTIKNDIADLQDAVENLDTVEVVATQDKGIQITETQDQVTGKKTYSVGHSDLPTIANAQTATVTRAGTQNPDPFYMITELLIDSTDLGHVVGVRESDIKDRLDSEIVDTVSSAISTDPDIRESLTDLIKDILVELDVIPTWEVEEE